MFRPSAAFPHSPGAPLFPPVLRQRARVRRLAAPRLLRIGDRCRGKFQTRRTEEKEKRSEGYPPIPSYRKCDRVATLRSLSAWQSQSLDMRIAQLSVGLVTEVLCNEEATNADIYAVGESRIRETKRLAKCELARAILLQSTPLSQ